MPREYLHEYTLETCIVHIQHNVTAYYVNKASSRDTLRKGQVKTVHYSLARIDGLLHY